MQKYQQLCLLIVLLYISFPLVELSLLFGVVTKDAALICSTSEFSKNGVTMRSDFDWIRKLGEECLVGLQGNPSDCEYLMSILESANREHQLAYADRSMSSHSIAHLCRRVIANSLRSNQLKVCALISGWNREANAPVMYWLDSIGMNFILHSYLKFIYRC